MKKILSYQKKTIDDSDCHDGTLGKLDIPFSYSGNNEDDFAIFPTIGNDR